jgi:hypothetical protein
MVHGAGVTDENGASVAMPTAKEVALNLGSRLSEQV